MAPDSNIRVMFATVPSFVRTTGLGSWNRYAAVNDEFIDIHMDRDAAKAAGLPDVIGMGNLRIAYLHNLLHDWLGRRRRRRRLHLPVPRPEPAGRHPDCPRGGHG